MSSRNPVVWSEGQLMRPQHFQQADRYAEHYVNARAVDRYAYGLMDIEIDRELLSIGQLALVRAKGLMPDGTPFDIPHDQPPPPPIDVASSTMAGQRVYLTLPVRSTVTGNVRWPDAEGRHRYALVGEDIKDVHSVQGDMAQIALAIPQFRLALEHEDRSALTGLAIARVRDLHADGSLVLDDDFYVTGLYVQAIRPMARFLHEASSLIQRRAAQLAERIASPEQSGVADVADFNLLQTLNRLQHGFLHMARDPDTRPIEAYLACGQACSELATFFDERRLPAAYPAYRHDAASEGFLDMQRDLRRLLGTVIEARALSLPLTEQRPGLLTATVADGTLIDTADFVLSVRAGMPLDDLRERFPLQAKIASQAQLPQLIQLQLPGIPLIALPAVPRHLPFHVGYTYFRLDRSAPLFRERAPKHGDGFGLHIAGDFPDIDIQFWAIRENDMPAINHRREIVLDVFGPTANPLVKAAHPLIAEVLAVCESEHQDNVTPLYERIRDRITDLSDSVRDHGYDSATLLAYRYALCAFIDEAIMATHWGRQSTWSQRSLLSHHHDETWGGEKFFTVLARMKSDARRYRDALEFKYLCLCLGFKGKYGQHARQGETRDELIAELHDTLRHLRGDAPDTLAEPPLVLAPPPRRLGYRTARWFPWIAATAVCVGMYMHIARYASRDTTPAYHVVDDLLTNDLDRYPPLPTPL